MKKVISLMLALTMCLGLTVTASAAGSCEDKHVLFIAVGHCNGDYVNVRTGPGTSYKSVGYAYKNDPYYYYQTDREPSDGSWMHVHGFGTTHENHIGWMYSQYYTATEAASLNYEFA